MRLLLQNGAKLEARTQTGKTAVHEACSGGQADALRVLLQHGANADAVDDYLETPLHMAAAAGEIDALRVLLRRGVGLNKLNDVRGAGVGRAAGRTLTRPCFVAQEGRTALHQAAAFGHEEVVEALLAHGADSRIKDEVRTERSTIDCTRLAPQLTR